MCINFKIIPLFLFLSLQVVMAQREDIVLQKERKEFAYKSIKELKEGALVVRLKTNHRKIGLLESTLRSSSLKKNQRKRHQAMLDATIKTRDDFNNAIADMFIDSFSFCTVYLMYDTSTNSLKKGIRAGFLLDSTKNINPDIQISESAIFIINYKKKSSEAKILKRSLIIRGQWT